MEKDSQAYSYRKAEQSLFDQKNHIAELEYMDSQRPIDSEEQDVNKYKYKYTVENSNQTAECGINGMVNYQAHQPIPITKIEYPQLPSEVAEQIIPSNVAGIETPDNFAITINRSFTSLKISPEIMKTLNYPKSLQVAYIEREKETETEVEMIISSKIPGNYNYFRVIDSAGGYSINSFGLIQEIRSQFHLNHIMNGPIAFRGKRFVKIGNDLVCLVKLSANHI